MAPKVESAGTSPQLAIDAGVALLDVIDAPVILLTCSQGGGIGFDVAEDRPQRGNSHMMMLEKNSDASSSSRRWIQKNVVSVS